MAGFSVAFTHAWPGPALRAATLASLCWLAACGVSYNPSVIDKRDREFPVDVVRLDGASVATANRSSYTPRELPDVFYKVASGGSARGLGALPVAPLIPGESPKPLRLVPLPNIEPEPYRIGVGDVVLIATRGTATTIEQLSGLLTAQNSRQGYTVRDDGVIAIPEVGSVEIAGMTLEAAEEALFQVLVENQFDPSFSLEVAEFNSQRVAVGGSVKAPKLVPIALSPVTLRDALVVSGGLDVTDEEFASIRIYRDGSLYQIPVENYLNDPKHQNVLLQDGDAVFVDISYDIDRALAFYEQQLSVVSIRNNARSVALAALQTEIQIQRNALQERRNIFEARTALDAEERDFVYLAGEVASQSRVALPFGRKASLADILFDGGGLKTETSDPTEIYIIRAPAGNVFERITAYHLDTKNAAALVLATRFEMRPNDIIFVEEQPITRWNRALQQAFPVILNSATN